LEYNQKSLEKGNKNITLSYQFHVLSPLLNDIWY